MAKIEVIGTELLGLWESVCNPNFNNGRFATIAIKEEETR
jgi:hypothetical protein